MSEPENLIYKKREEIAKLRLQVVLQTYVLATASKVKIYNGLDLDIRQNCYNPRSEIIFEQFLTSQLKPSFFTLLPLTVM